MTDRARAPAFHLDSAELSWFAEGPVPAPVASWFEGLPGRGSAWQPRQDFYLRLAGAEDIGVKLREGRLEIKRRLGFEPAAQVGAARVVASHWRKWATAVGTGPGNGEESGEALARPVEDWIVVSKTRTIRSFEGGAEFARGSAVRCALELAQVEALGHQAWRVGLECTGDDPDGRSAFLLQVGGAVFDSEGAPDLEVAEPVGYPAWLARLLAASG